ncbi:PHA/PHB synthase family protein [Donghicola mangrovi]|uniref:Class I poly(R)-hydroxyalkanoic acid synthase n=1 Tax=Donghicola mangrovi TaxID=2729614 RepID=A0A850Q3B0_9RHOB|nr:class I poly(R)-hydroxyalkanoic acid synthase [Donghicola mangrovi]NVO23444.1 class I poly(R)-hydroxyalkanoic acid synthase [Donghicola mangrovi]
MTTHDGDTGTELVRLNENISKIEELSKRLVTALSHYKAINPALQGPGQDLYMKAAVGYWAEWVQNPAKILEHQVEYWGKSLQHYMEAQKALTKGELASGESAGPRDKRFANPLWDTHPYFNYVKQQYQLNSAAITKAIDDVADLDDVDRKRLRYFSQQIVDLMAPTNFLATNPDALERAVETEGQSLVDGLENLVRDLEANDGRLLVTLADEKAFEVGGNIATTEGKVVFRNHMFELIQYTPTTETVHEIPLLIFPPWINRFYILDLKDKNSMIKWAVEQGYTVFVVSWINPDPSYRDVKLDDYITDGYLTAIKEVQGICNVKQVNAVGYCIAGTTLSLTMALLKKRGETPIKSATLFTTLTDFSDQGEFTVFLGDDFVDGIEEEAMAEGYLNSFFMSRTFSFLRSNDLIYGPAINRYMKGEAPPAFDLLFWNGDSTNLPGAMAIQYLRDLCQKNKFVDGGIEICGEVLNIKDVTVPICAIACETDHIAAWKSSYNGVRQMGSRSKTFIVSQSGHIAGIVNPPSKGKYGHYTNPKMSMGPDEWMAEAEFTPGSWWPRWDEWLANRSGKQVPAREHGDSTHPVLADAPGTYVVMRASA